MEAPLPLLQPLRVNRCLKAVPRLCSSSRCCSAAIIWDSRNCVGENLKYLARDRWIGWSGEQRANRLGLVADNTRFLILPWVRVPHLASHLLGRVAARLSADWQQKYGHPIYLLESFLEQSRFAGTCYRAAGWVQVA